MLNDRLYYGAPPCKEFVFYPLKIDMLEVKSNSRRTVWNSFEAVLQCNRLLLYSPNNSHCIKVFSLEDVEITQNPVEAPDNSIRITNKHFSDNSKIIHFYNNDDASSWQMVGLSSPFHL